MSYIPGSEDTSDSWMLWTNEANYNTTMDPAKFSYVNWEAYFIRDPVREQAPKTQYLTASHEQKYLDRSMSEQMGLPVWLPLPSGPRRNTTSPNSSLSYRAVLEPQQVDRAVLDPWRQSSGSSSQVLPAGSVGPGGTHLGYIRYVSAGKRRRRKQP